MTKAIRRTAPEIIATWLCWDIHDVTDMVYQPTRYTAPRVYSISLKGDIEYVCCPTERQKPPSRWTWTEIGELYGRKILGATGAFGQGDGSA